MWRRRRDLNAGNNGGRRALSQTCHPLFPKGLLADNWSLLYISVKFENYRVLELPPQNEIQKRLFTDRIVHLQRNDFAFLKYVIYCCCVYADLAVIKYTTSWQHEKTAKLWLFVGEMLSIFLGLFTQGKKKTVTYSTGVRILSKTITVIEFNS